jgi:hypothetical protein
VAFSDFVPYKNKHMQLTLLQHEELPDGFIKVNRKDFETLIDERNLLADDIVLTTKRLTQLLTQIGMLTPDNDFQMPRLAFLAKLLTNGESATKQFEYMKELVPVFERYAPLVKELEENK